MKKNWTCKIFGHKYKFLGLNVAYYRMDDGLGISVPIPVTTRFYQCERCEKFMNDNSHDPSNKFRYEKSMRQKLLDNGWSEI